MTQTTLREYLRATEDAISSGRTDDAMASCQTILTYFPEALEAQRLLGEVYLAKGHLEEAQQTFEWILTNDPENVIVYCDRALISERVSDIDTALDCYQQAYELSRGNANIRQEFNQLSARAGQQEFMFSRAGLARLYMRGDLLTQAIQEWDAVLAISPDRLDARMGLMETFWREGLYDKAESIATNLLEEIPTCLKALLYLAHITSISNTQRARELLQRAASLDPELRMAQEIFADLNASQPNDPFLELIKKEPILLENGVPLIKPVISTSAPDLLPSQPEPSQATSTSPYDNWNTPDNWPKQAAVSQTVDQPIPETPARANWATSEEALHAASQSGPSVAEWQAQLEVPSPSLQEQPWYQKDQFPSANVDPMQSWESVENESPEEEPAQPAWLNTLTRSEQQPMVEITPSALAPTDPTPFARPGIPPTSPEERPAIQAAQQRLNTQEQSTPTDEAMPFLFPPEEGENEGEMGWPEWLKSLGAESLEPEQPISAELPELIQPMPTPAQAPIWDAPQKQVPGQPTIEADPWAALPAISANNEAWGETNSQPDWMQQLSAPQQSPVQPTTTPDWMQQLSHPEQAPAAAQPIDPQPAAAPDWMQQFASPQAQEPYQNSSESWMHQLSASSSSSTRNSAELDQNYLTSLEDLEKNLQSQGFIPLAPGALASIAQTQPGAPMPAQPQAYEEPPISSALAQLGNFSQSAMASAPTTTSNETWWNSTQQSGSSSNPFAALGARTGEEGPHNIPPLPATPLPVAPQGFVPGYSQELPADISLTPTYRSDALLDNDLETTMKRPAIKLQPIHPPVEEQSDRIYSNGKNHSVEHKPVERIDENNLSNHERLIKGYQYQLAGDYDEAMQEYRLIIRNAPELLDDVISNMRALLKLNPRFSLGYRVLGDAYMRKGEYLQAMESYNKALTMAKKARN